VITRRGKPIAELVPRCGVRDLLPQLQALRDGLPEQDSSGVETQRMLRGSRA
jgi:antitoxin (DNA-binding transcriptional repressor) of toxin-antitoxin stability system